MPGNNHNSKRERFTNELDLEEFAQEWSSGCATPVSITNSWIQISSREMSSASEAEEEEEIEEEVNDPFSRRRTHIGLEETLLKASLHSLLATTSTSAIPRKKAKKSYTHSTSLAASTPIPVPQLNGSPPMLPLPSSLPNSPSMGGIPNMLLNNESDAFKHPIERTASRTSACMDENMPQAILLDECGFEEAISHDITEVEKPELLHDGPSAQACKPGIPHTLAMCWDRARRPTPPSALVDVIASDGLLRNHVENHPVKRKREISSQSKTKPSHKTRSKSRKEDVTMRLWMAALISVALFGTGFSVGFGAGYFLRYSRFYATS
ncbi:hypothetical protein K493DRAFT_334156 [Basidiobolus meristosporus CBS 931.73]|uniref:Uncharacterized protein n=1 Tax=Basidiobolus meristosporus CBS 931.73 TaxID=1314790 RepID=A0A1Y1Z1I0_9FUNG|nr:hypothetical protein K493DRAFT_334156 [Basidiobolus meristosporus CBS 931.73]|eukprot:ORY03797.1 hypothetical protein K493DRAFT_334156 [Basidiobolus meristosporus CBS 931.73]